MGNYSFPYKNFFWEEKGKIIFDNVPGYSYQRLCRRKVEGQERRSYTPSLSSCALSGSVSAVEG